METITWSLDRYADYFVNYLFDEYQGSRHVRRVATWIGFILKAVESVADDGISLNRRRQLQFSFRGDRFKVKFNHSAGDRGGIQIIEVLPQQGSPEGRIVATVTNLTEAEQLHRSLRDFLEAPASAFVTA
jgi:hypothetical protein